MRLLLALAGLGIPCALAQSPSCTLTVSPSTVALGVIGTESPGGFPPDTPQTISILTTGNCSALTAVALPNSTHVPNCGGNFTGSFTGVPWLVANAAGNSVTFTALSNAASFVRTGNIAISSAGGGAATVTVTEAGSTDPVLPREVRVLYQSILGRDPDPAGFAFWTGGGAAGLGQMADSFMTSPEAFDSDFAVIAAYQAALGAAPTFAQFSSSVNALRAGAQTVAGLYTSLLSANSDATPANIATLYGNLLGREPQPVEVLEAEVAGLPNWFETLIGYPAGNTIVAPPGSAANEFQSTAGFHTDHTMGLYIDLLYFLTLGRSPDPAGYQFWMGIANRGGPGLLFQGAAGYATRIQITGTGAPGQGFVGSPELSCPLFQ